MRQAPAGHFRSVGFNKCGPESSRSCGGLSYSVLDRLGRIHLLRSPRQFMSRNSEEQSWLQKNTWCDQCARPDLGMIEPVEYEEGKTIYIEGKCAVCGSKVRSSVESRDAT